MGSLSFRHKQYISFHERCKEYSQLRSVRLSKDFTFYAYIAFNKQFGSTIEC